MLYTNVIEKKINGDKQLVKVSVEFNALPFILDETFSEKLQREVVRTKLCDAYYKDSFVNFSQKDRMLAEHFGIEIADETEDDYEHVIDEKFNDYDVPECLKKVFALYHMLYANHYYDGNKKCSYAVNIESLRTLCNQWAYQYGDNADGNKWSDEQRKLFNDIKAELENQAQKRLNDKAVDNVRKGYAVSFSGSEVKVFLNGCLHKKTTKRNGSYKYESASADSKSFGRYFLNFILSDKKDRKAKKVLVDKIL